MQGLFSVALSGIEDAGHGVHTTHIKFLLETMHREWPSHQASGTFEAGRLLNPL